MVVKATSSITIADVSDGLDGTGISSTKIEYQAGSSGTSAPTGTWSTSVPSTSASAPYLWTRVTYNYSDGRNPEYVYSVGSTPEGIEIGGRNLLPKAKYGDNIKNISNNSVSGYGYIFSEQSTSPNPMWSSELNLQPGVSYTLSFIAWIDVSDSDAIQALCVDLFPDTLPQIIYSWTNGVTNIPTKFVWTFKSTHSDMLSCRLRFFCDISSPDGYKFKYVPLYITDIKLEEGNKATDWTPAPEDTEEKITELNTKYTEVKQTADGLSTTVASHTTKLQSVENQVTTNLLKPTLATTTQNGITCTNNGDGTYTLNGKATANTNFTLLNNFDFSGKLKLVGCPNGGSLSTYRVCYTSDVDNVYNDIGDGIIIEHFSSETYPNAKFILFVTSGATLNNIVFKPMITTNLNATYDDFVQYTGSTGSLNGDLANNSKMTEYAETVATQTAEKFSWLVKSGTSSTDFTLTDRTAKLVSDYINLNGLVSFSGLGSDTKKSIIDSVDVGGRNLAVSDGIRNASDVYFDKSLFTKNGTITFARSAIRNGGIILDHSDMYEPSTNYVLRFEIKDNNNTVNNFYFHNGWCMVNIFVYVDGVYKGRYSEHIPCDFTDGKYHEIIVYFETPSVLGNYEDFNNNTYFQPLKGTELSYNVTLKNFKIEKGNKATDWTPAPEDIDEAIDTAQAAADGANSTLANWCYNNDKTYINGGKIATGSITAKQIDVTDLFAQSITATGTITGGSFVGSSFEGATGSFTGEITASSGKIGFLNVGSTYLRSGTSENNSSFLMKNGYIAVQSFSSNGYRDQYTEIEPDGIYTTGDVEGGGTSLSYEHENSVRCEILEIGAITINSNSPFSMNIANQVDEKELIQGVCLGNCWPHSTWAFACTPILNGTNLYISTTTTQVYTVSVVIFYKDI